jgi:hypothetical protein
MTCGRARLVRRTAALDGAAASHSAELVRGDFLSPAKAPHPALRATFSPREKGRHAHWNPERQACRFFALRRARRASMFRPSTRTEKAIAA